MVNNDSGNEAVSEHDACIIAGVSQRTLLRFTEAGYLSVTLNGEGVRLYRSAQLREIFGVAADVAGGTSDNNANLNSADIATPIDIQKEDADQCFINTSSVEADIDQGVAGYSSTTQTNISGYDSQLTTEIKRLENLLAIQERILDSKDDEIADLRNQRTWLRQRIEKLEEKSDRDQLLLLSETQTIRSLISYQESRKSGFRQFLEWAGLCKVDSPKALSHTGEYNNPSAGSPGRTIEVTKAANGD
jgi:hypothetical protein